MKLTKESIKHNASWKGYRLPQYDIDAVREATHKAPTWLHFGAGNLFRAFPAVLAQRLLTAGLTDTGIICCDGYDEELIDRCYRACDHLSLSVTLYSNGTINKEIVASVTESLKLSEDGARLTEVFAAPSLQMVTFTITEKGLAALPALSGKEAEMAEEFLNPLYVQLLKVVKENPEQQAEFVQKNGIKSMRMSAICSHLTRRGYVVEGGLFKRKLRITEKGAAALQKYA